MVEKQHEDRIERLQRELEDGKEQITNLKRDVAKIEFYEKKVEQMTDLKNDLTDAQMLIQQLQTNLDMSNQEAENEQHIEDTLNRIKDELDAVKLRSNGKDLNIQEL